MKLTKAADLIKVQNYTPHRARAKGEKRAKRENPTIDAVKQYNQRLRAEKLQMLIYLNFRHGYVVILEYSEGKRPQTYQDADKAMMQTLKRIKRTDKDFKYIATTERGEKNHNLHHHVVVESLEKARELCKAWNGYTPEPMQLYTQDDFERLAYYLAKQDTKEEKPKGCPTYHASRKLEQPEIELLLIDEPWKDEPEPPEGYENYEIIPQSIVNGFNEYIGIKYQSYMLKRKTDPSERQKEHTRRKRERVQKRNIYHPIQRAIKEVTKAAVIGVKMGLSSGIKAAADYLNQEPCATSHKKRVGKRRTATRKYIELFKNSHRE